VVFNSAFSPSNASIRSCKASVSFAHAGKANTIITNITHTNIVIIRFFIAIQSSNRTLAVPYYTIKAVILLLLILIYFSSFHNCSFTCILYTVENQKYGGIKE